MGSKDRNIPNLCMRENYFRATELKSKTSPALQQVTTQVPKQGGFFTSWHSNPLFWEGR